MLFKIVPKKIDLLKAFKQKNIFLDSKSFIQVVYHVTKKGPRGKISNCYVICWVLNWYDRTSYLMFIDVLIFDIRVIAEIYLAAYKVLQTKTLNSCPTQWTSDWGLHTVFVRGRGLKKSAALSTIKFACVFSLKCRLFTQNIIRVGHLHQKALSLTEKHFRVLYVIIFLVH